MTKQELGFIVSCVLQEGYKPHMTEERYIEVIREIYALPTSDE